MHSMADRSVLVKAYYMSPYEFRLLESLQSHFSGIPLDVRDVSNAWTLRFQARDRAEIIPRTLCMICRGINIFLSLNS